MSYTVSQIIPALQTFKIIGDANEFEKWMKQQHPEKDISEVFEGYRYSLSCCINTFVDAISVDQSLGISNDFLLDNAISQIIPLHLVQSNCEKAIFLNNIKPIIKSVVRAESYAQISQAINQFNTVITSKFDVIFKDYVSVSKEINVDKTEALNLLLIDFAHTYMVQINNNGPTANSPNVLAVDWTKKELKDRYLNGYKYAIQFLWYQLLGDTKFKQTHLTKIHLADSWRKYKLIEKEKTDNPMFDRINEEFKLEEQTCFDSYFYWIQKEITEPYDSQNNIAVYSIDSYIVFSGINYDKKEIFSELLNNTKEQNTSSMTWSEKIHRMLHWYPFELVNAEKAKMFFGVSSFNTMLAGTVKLHKPKESELKKIYVIKFIHPHANEPHKRDYSYGILIDTKSAAGHYSSGWVIYQNACGDYSGFSGSEHKSTEKIINEYKKKGKIDAQELVIPLKDFVDFTNQSVLDHKELSILEKNKLIPDILQKSKAHLFELFTFYTCSKYYKDFKIQLNADKKSTEGEKDVVLQNDDEVILIECKLNPQSYNMEDLLRKMEDKLKGYKQQRKSCQFWFWHKPSVQNLAFLNNVQIENKPILVITVSDPKGEKVLRGISLKELNFIMQDYEDSFNGESYEIISFDN